MSISYEGATLPTRRAARIRTPAAILPDARLLSADALTGERAGAAATINS
ncbi:MAG TPA: hypothetical protein VEZ40_13550 [Pyrinomonadaceae bacterium]|nr:hypothetical protein [Pyrinomonadaceae bacterium]